MVNNCCFLRFSLRMVKVFTQDRSHLMFADEYFLVNYYVQVWRKRKALKAVSNVSNGGVGVLFSHQNLIMEAIEPSTKL